jgi:hypothetical protein
MTLKSFIPACAKEGNTDTEVVEMAEELVYLGLEWTNEARKRLETALDPTTMNKITTSMVDVYESCPDGVSRWLYVKCVDGALAHFDVGEGNAPEAEFRVIGKYDTFAAISRGEMGSQRALMTGKLKLKGNMAKALRLAPLADRINKVLATIPSKY